MKPPWYGWESIRLQDFLNFRRRSQRFLGLGNATALFQQRKRRLDFRNTNAGLTR